MFAEPDRNVFRLTDEAGVSWVWGDNLSGKLQKTKLTPRAVLDGQTLTLRRGKAVWRYEKDGQVVRCRGKLLENPGWEVLGALRRRASEKPQHQHGIRRK